MPLSSEGETLTMIIDGGFIVFLYQQDFLRGVESICFRDVRNVFGSTCVLDSHFVVYWYIFIFFSHFHKCRQLL